MVFTTWTVFVLAQCTVRDLFLTDRYFQNLIIIINNVDKKNDNSNTAI